MANKKIIEAGAVHPDGVQVGLSGEKVGFIGAVPVVQRASADQAALATTGATTSTPYGYSQAQANGLIAGFNEIRATLVALGFWKGSA